MSSDVRSPGTSLSDRVAEEIRVWMVRRRTTGRALAKQLNVSPAWISYRLTGQQPIDLNDLNEIAGALGVEPHVIVTAAVKGPTLQHHPAPHGGSSRPPGRAAGRAAGPGRTARTRAPFAA